MKRKIITVLLLVISVVALIVFIEIKKTKNKFIYFTEKSDGYSFPITHTWYSSLFYDPFSKPLFALPLYYSITSTGIQIGKPIINISDKSIVGSHSPDLTIKTNILSKTVNYAGEWDVKLTAKTDTGNINIHIIKGSPVFYFKANTGNITLLGNINDNKQIDSSTFLVKSNQSVYLIHGDKIEFSQNQINVTTKNDFGYIILFPDETDSITKVESSFLTKILDCATNQQEGTSFDFNFNYLTNNLKITNIFTNDINKKYLFTIWPHQTSLNGNYETLGTYSTVRGKLTLTCANSLSFNIKTFEIPITWNSVFDQNKLKDPSAKELFEKDLSDFNKLPYPSGIYFKGKYVKNLTDLWEISQNLGLTTTKNDLETKIKNLLLSEINNFQLDPTTSLLINKNPEFGNEKGNDHHLQYGYYIYSYAKLYDTFTPDEKKKIDGLMTLFLNEGIPAVLNTSSYPRKIRFLDTLELHSWADAQSLFEDGNNQESSSEALFYWYSWYLWGVTTKNTKTADWGRFAYFSELTGRNTYWFMINNDNIRNNFKSPIISLVWGGKDDYATWFSSEDDKVFGIQVLPPNPADSIAFKLPAKSFTSIARYYDNVLGSNPAVTRSFGPYYVYFKKINSDFQNEYSNINEQEFIPRSLLFLLRML